MSEVEARVHPLVELRAQVLDRREEIARALPPQVDPDRFIRVLMTAVQLRPELLECERRSLLTECIRAASDGLMPDGVEGVMSVRWDYKRRMKVASWQRMVRGIQKLVRNSGEVDTLEAHVVRQNDEFEYSLGDEPRIHHKPYIGADDAGHIVAAYSICVLKSGTKTREVMSISEIRQIRDQSSDGWKAYSEGKIKQTPWATAEGEMSRKTVIRRHSKYIPMSTDLLLKIQSDGDDERLEDNAPAALPEPPPRRLAAKLARLGAPDPISPPEGAVDETPPGDPELSEEREEAGVDPAPPAPAAAPASLSLVAVARQRGRVSKAEGHTRKAMPAEYRDDERVAEHDGWLEGFAAEEAEQKRAGQESLKV